MAEWIDLGYIGDSLTLGGVGFVVGVAAPMAFRLIGYLFDVVKKFVR